MALTMEPCYTAFSLLAVICLTVYSAEGQCMFLYTTQPSSTTKNCNPYNQNGFIRIVLDCILRKQTDAFEIQWFRENTTRAVEDLGRGNPDNILGGIDWWSRYSVVNQYNPSYLGKYWCQVINTTADPDQPLMRSNVFTLLAPEDYSQLTCSAVVQSEFNSTCADLPVQITLLSSLTTTTLSSYMSIQCSKIPDCTTISLTTAMRTAAGITSSLSYTILSPASPTANVLPIVYSIAAVLSAVIVIISVIAVTVILLLVRRQRRKTNCKGKQAQKSQHTQHSLERKVLSTEKVKIGEEPQYCSPHYFDAHPISPLSHTHNDDQQSSSSTHYQPLDTVTTDYTSMYTTPKPTVKIGDQEYATVDPTRREEHTYAIPQ